MKATWRMIPGLKELVEAENLSEDQANQLARMWDSVRGHQPRTLEEWMPMYNAAKKYLIGGTP